MTRTKKLNTITAKDQQTLSQYVETTRTSGERVTISPTGYTTIETINVHTMPTSWNYVSSESLKSADIGRVNISDMNFNNMAVLNFSEHVKMWQSISPHDAAPPNIDFERFTEKTRQPLPIDVMSSLKDSAEILFNEVAKKNQQLDDSRYRRIENQLSTMRAILHDLTSTNKRQFFSTKSRKVGKRQMTKLLKTLELRYSNTPFLETITFQPISEGIEIVFIHSAKNISQTIERIIDIFTKVQDEFPDLYLEPNIVPKSEVDISTNKDFEVINIKKV